MEAQSYELFLRAFGMPEKIFAELSCFIRTGEVKDGRPDSDGRTLLDIFAAGVSDSAPVPGIQQKGGASAPLSALKDLSLSIDG